MPLKIKIHLLYSSQPHVLSQMSTHDRALLHYHAQAMFVDFGMAAQYGGNCYLRFDDTNPEAEKQEYIDHILVSAHNKIPLKLNVICTPDWRVGCGVQMAV